MSIGHELWTLARALGYYHQTGEDVELPDWGYRELFSIPREYFVGGPADPPQIALDGPTFTEIAPHLKQILQPSQKALQLLLEAFPAFWDLEPPVLGIHVDESVSDEYLALARAQIGPVGSLAVFGDDPDEDDLDTENVWYCRADAEWPVPQLLSFCDFHVLSGHPDSWWGAFLSDDQYAVYPSTRNESTIFLASWVKVDQ